MRTQYILNVKNIDRHYIKDSLLILKYCIHYYSSPTILIEKCFPPSPQVNRAKRVDVSQLDQHLMFSNFGINYPNIKLKFR